MRILSISGRKDLKNLMQGIKVDDYGIKIMLPKAQHRLLKINALSSISANILKQEMLSLGGDVALARGALTGKSKKTDCLVMGNVSQINLLRQKLLKQPFGLNMVAKGIGLALGDFQRSNFQFKAGKYNLKLGSRSFIMGIINVTPDSLSGDGLLNLNPDKIAEYGISLVREGADIIDVGGESTRPGAKRLSLKEEASRVIPAIKALVKKVNVPVSVDTYKPEVAKMALDCGASIVNDISGLRNLKMAKVVSRYKAGVIIMHMLKNPSSMQDNPMYNSLIDDICGYLKSAIESARSFGIGEDSIMIDPGIGFGKALGHNLEILKRLAEFKSLGKPILVGVSRKSFIGKILNNKPQDRLFGTVASSVSARINGADFFRVHDVRAVKEALMVADNIKR